MNVFVLLQSLEDVSAAAGKMAGYGLTPFFAFSAVIDAENPGTMIGEFDQGGFTLPVRDMYLSPSQLLTDYQTHVTKVTANSHRVLVSAVWCCIALVTTLDCVVATSRHCICVVPTRWCADFVFVE